MKRFAAFAIFCGWITLLPAQNLERQFYGTNNGVYDIAVDDETAYLVGDFTIAGASSAGVAWVNLQDGKVDTNFPRINPTGDALCAVADGSGGYFIGGIFSEVEGLPQQNLVHVSPNGELDLNWQTHVSGGDVRCMAVYNGTLYLGGLFFQVGDSSRQYLAAVDIATGEVLPWNPSPSDWVEKLIVSTDRLYAAGWFGSIYGQGQLNVAAFDLPSGEYLPDWDPQPTSYVLALALDEDRLYLGGNFFTVGGEQRERIAAVDAQTGALLDWKAGNGTASGGIVHDILVHEGIVYAGGSFDFMGGEKRPMLAAINAANGSILSLAPAIDNTVNGLAIFDQVLYAGGTFSEINGQSRRRLAAFQLSDGSLDSWNPAAQDNVFDLAVDGNWLLVSGRFGLLGGGLRNGAAALNLASGELTAWDPDLDDVAYSVAVANDRVFIGGRFETVGGEARRQLAAVDKISGELLDWDAGVGGFNASILALEAAGNTLYVGGNYTGTFAGYDIESAEKTRTFAIPNSLVRDIELTAERIYISGGFSTVGGEPRTLVAAYDRSSGDLLDWNPGFYIGGEVRSIVEHGSSVYLAGSMFVNGDNNYLIACERSNGAQIDWFPQPDIGLYSLKTSGDTLFVGGEFTRTSGADRLGVAAYDLTDRSLLDWRMDISNDDRDAGFVRTLEIADSRLMAGGFFDLVDGISQFGFGVVNDPNIVVGIGDSPIRTAPANFVLQQNYPNPFNPETVIGYSLAVNSYVQLEIYNIAGQKIRTLIDGQWQAANSYSVVWDGSNSVGKAVGSGVYIYRLMTEKGSIQSRKMVLLR